MACNDPMREDLVALLQDELPPERAETIRAHMEDCAECREELEKFRTVFHLSHQVGLIEPSAAFRKKLEERIQEAVKQSRRSHRRKRAGSTSVVLPGALPAPPDSGRAARAKNLGKSSARLLSYAGGSARSGRRSAEPRRGWIRYVALAAALVVISLTLTHFVILPQFHSQTDPRAQELALAEKRWNQRRVAESWEKILKGGQVEVAEATHAETLYLVNQFLPAFQEDCVVAFSDADLERMRKEGKVKKEQLDEMLRRSVRVGVNDGRITLPAHFLARLGGAGAKLAVLACPNRLEFWTQKKLAHYLRAAPKIETVPPADERSTPAQPAPPAEPGLPPEADTPGSALPAA